jgi:predicted DNA-binding transcriptional regulator AlpA
MTTSKTRAPPVTRRAYRINETCIALGICRSNAYSMMDSGELPYVVIGGRRHITSDTIEALVRGESPGQAHQPRPTRRRKDGASAHE